MTDDITVAVDTATADALEGVTPTFERGEAETISVVIGVKQAYQALTIGENDTETIDEGDTLVVRESVTWEDGSSLSFEDDSALRVLDTAQNEYDRFREFFAVNENAIRTGVTDTGVPWFREDLSEDAPVDTLVVPVEFGNDVGDARDMWCLVVGASDATERTARGGEQNADYRVELELLALAPREEYADRDAVRDAFGADII